MLSLKEYKYTDILKSNKEKNNSVTNENTLAAGVLSNIIVHQLNDVLKFSTAKFGVHTQITSGDYDNIVQDSANASSKQIVVVFWELCNLIDGLQYKANLLSEDETRSLISKTKSEIDFVFSNLGSVPLVLFNKFSACVFNHLELRENNFDRICDELNAYLINKKPVNVFLVDIDKVIAKNGISSSIDLRYYFSSKALYTLDFFKSYCEFVLPVILSVRGKAKKALILDCDNTLWKGIIGEDGFDGIKMSGASKEGVPFEYVQSIAVNLSRKGVIIGLNSKNNAADVDAVVLNHKDQVLKQENIVIKKVNWQDKVSNLKEIASDLNIGADSFIMVDDSDFEVNFIRESLPYVNVVQVPANGYLYPFELIAASQYFFNMNATAEDLKKGEMYKQQAERDNQKAEFENIEDYLKSLELTLTISENNTSHVERIAQLTQKTNQFNLTTQRYTETEISNFMQSGNHMVFDFALADKFGDYGITGIAIVELSKEKKVAVIDSMLMSCRVIGRNVEFAFLNHILKRIKEAGIETVTSSYNKTIKNDQVKDFYDKAHFKKVKSSDQEHLYETKISDINFINIPYLNIQLQ